MNRFQRQLLSISLISSLALPLTAMAGMPSNAPQGMGPGPHQAMMATLDLTAEQRNAMQEIRQRFRQDHQALREQERKAIADILTEQQRASLMQARQQRQGAARHDQRQMRQQARLDALLDSWSLSDEDRATLQDARQTLMDKMRALHDEAFDSREAKRAAVEHLRQDYQAALDEVLDEAQRHALVVLMMPQQGHHPRGYHAEERAEERNDAPREWQGERKGS